MRERGLWVAGVVREAVEVNRRWVERLHLPYPLLADPDGGVGRAFCVTRRFGIGAWSLEFFRRSTFLVDANGIIAAVWEAVAVRGHAAEIMAAADALAGADGRRSAPIRDPAPPGPEAFGRGL